jgi:hypothetical protein
VNNTDLRIIDKALESLEGNPLFKGMWKYAVNEGENIEISLYIHNQTLRFRTETRHEVRNKHLPRLLELRNSPKPFILVANKIYSDAKEVLRQNQIPYIEANGNISIQEEGLFIWVDHNKPLSTGPEKTNRAFTKTGLKVVFHFLMNDRFLSMPYREIAELTGTSLGNITNVMNALKAHGYLIRSDTYELKLINKRQLFDKWIAAYDQVLKPAMEIGSFRFINTMDLENWKRVPLENRKSMWGAEAGGHLLTGQLRPVEFTIYTAESRNDLVNNYRLIRDPGGNVKIFTKFWNYDDYRSNVAPPLLVYADLMNTGDKKCVEAAERVFDELLREKLKD